MLVLREADGSYSSKGKPVKDKDILAYIAALVIPPKYRNVEIYIHRKQGRISAPPKLTYKGIDEAGRIQYGYSEAWKIKSRKKKFSDLIEFGRALPRIKMAIQKIPPNAADKDYNIATILRVVMSCHFRLGNLRYKDIYNSYGATNLEVRHISFPKYGARIQFVGKKGVKNTCKIEDAALVGHLKRLVDGKSPKDPVFSYVFEDCVSPVRAADVNAWMGQFGKNITSKMFRTYAANVTLIDMLNSPPSSKDSDRKKSLNAALDTISELIHNTRAVCRKEYIHPGLIEMYLGHPIKWKRAFVAKDLSPEAEFLAYLRSP